MENKKIVIITGYDGFFGQSRKPWASINTNSFIEELKKRLYTVECYEFYEIANDLVKIENSLVIYSFSQRDNLRFYIKDLIKHLKTGNNLILPDYELLYCHENKGYQELLKKQLGLKQLGALYFSSKRELKHLEISFPKVLKTVKGSNGRGVYLVKSKEEVYSIMKKLEKKLTLFEKIDLLRRKYIRKQKNYPGYPDYDVKIDYLQYKDYIQKEEPFILQDFVQNLNCDYRVIVLKDRFYAVKRMTKEGDFRASGTKRFVFEYEMPKGLLDYALYVLNTFNTPFLSMDIGYDGTNFYLFEYQAIHFGINAIVRSNGYYMKKTEEWEFIKEKTIFEYALADSLDKYIQEKFID